MKQLLHNLAALIPEDQLDIPKENLRETTVTDGLQIFFGIAAAVAVLIIAISALRITISRGNAQDVSKARDAIIYAAVGLAITLSGFAIVTFVIERVSA
jgi:hypothetical protein